MLRSRPAFLLIEQMVALTLVILGSLILTISLSQFKYQQTQKRETTALYAVASMTALRLKVNQPVTPEWRLNRQRYRVTTNNQGIYVKNKAGEQVAVKWQTY